MCCSGVASRLHAPAAAMLARRALLLISWKLLVLTETGCCSVKHLSWPVTKQR